MLSRREFLAFGCCLVGWGASICARSMLPRTRAEGVERLYLPLTQTGRGKEAPSATLPAATPTPTTAPVATYLFVGQVVGGPQMPGEPLAGATVSVVSCFPRRFSATTDVTGAYSLAVPGLYVAPCSSVQFEVSLAGYQTHTQQLIVQGLSSQVEIDVLLSPID